MHGHKKIVGLQFDFEKLQNERDVFVAAMLQSRKFWAAKLSVVFHSLTELQRKGTYHFVYYSLGTKYGIRWCAFQNGDGRSLYITTCMYFIKFILKICI